ncbi:hypothetical protein C8R46DRAFT_1295836, partial [Mycena filopes]
TVRGLAVDDAHEAAVLTVVDTGNSFSTPDDSPSISSTSACECVAMASNDGAEWARGGAGVGGKWGKRRESENCTAPCQHHRRYPPDPSHKQQESLFAKRRRSRISKAALSRVSSNESLFLIGRVCRFLYILTQLEEKAAAAAVALRAVTGADQYAPAPPPSTTTTIVVTSGEHPQTVVYSSAPAPPPPPPPPPPAPPAPTEVPSASDDPTPVVVPPPPKTGLTDPADKGSIFLGLRVYTKRDAAAVIGGQLRHEMHTSFAGLSLASV